MPSTGKFTRAASRFVLTTVVCCLAAASANAYRDELRAARDFLDIGAYEQAISQFERALSDSSLRGRTRDKAEVELSTARGQLAAEKYRLGRRLEQRGQPIGALNAYSRAAELAPDDQSYREAFQRLDREYSGARERSADILAQARVSRDWESALGELERMQGGRVVPEVRIALDTLRQEATGDLQERSDAALSEGRYQSALDYIVRAARFSESRQVQNRKLARHHLMLAERAWNDGRYGKAYEELSTSLSFEPGNAHIQAFGERLEGQWLGVLYNDAVTARANGDMQRALSKFEQISRFQPGYLDVGRQLDELRQTVVSGYYERAENIMDSGDDRLGLALAYYMMTAQEESGAYPDVYDKIARAKSRLRDSMQFRVSLNVKNSSSEPGAEGIVRDNILSNMRSSSLRHVQVLEREALDDILREQGLGQAFFDESTAVEVKKIRGIQSGIYVDVVRFSVDEHGRDRPSFGSARYISGTRFVPNPRHSSLKQQVSIAQQDLLQAQQSANRAQAEQNRLMSQSQGSSGDRVAALGALGSVLSNVGASSQLRGAQQRLDQLQYELSGEPPQLEEDVYSDFRYQIFDLELSGEVLLSYRIVDFATSEVSESQTATARDVVQDRWVPGDPGKGVRADPDELPSESQFKQRLLDAAMESLIAGLEQQLGAGVTSSFSRAQQAARDGNREMAIDQYIRYLYGGVDLDSEEARTASDYVYEEVGVQLLKRKT